MLNLRMKGSTLRCRSQELIKVLEEIRPFETYYPSLVELTSSDKDPSSEQAQLNKGSEVLSEGRERGKSGRAKRLIFV